MITETSINSTNTITITDAARQAEYDDVNAEWEKWLEEIDEETINELALILK
jgi:hypothetical protein